MTRFPQKMSRMIGYQSETAKRNRTKMPVSIRKLSLHLENKFIPKNGLVSVYHQDSTRPFFIAGLWLVIWYLPLGKELFLLAIKLFNKIFTEKLLQTLHVLFQDGRKRQAMLNNQKCLCSVFSKHRLLAKFAG